MVLSRTSSNLVGSTSGSGHVEKHVTVDGFICVGGAVINNRKTGERLIFELMIPGSKGPTPMRTPIFFQFHRSCDLSGR